jgi:hypothetical protein
MKIRFLEHEAIFFPVLLGNSVANRRLGKNLRRSLTLSSDLDLQTNRDLERNLRLILPKGSKNFVAFPHSISALDITALRSFIPQEYVLTFVHWAGRSQPGFGLLRSESLPPTQYVWDNPEVVHAARDFLARSLTHTFELTCPTQASLEMDVHVHVNAHLNEALCGASALITLVFSFLGNTSLSEYSIARWHWTFDRSVLQISLVQQVADLMDDPVLMSEASLAEFTQFGNRSHCLMSYSKGRVYFWSGAPPLLSSVYGPHLFKTTSLLMTNFPWMNAFRDCLLTLYRNGNDHLNFHSDIFDGHPESVILFFAGVSRDLCFRIMGEKDHFMSISCTSDLCVILTPLANILFQHGKSRSFRGSGPSLSLAYRNALGLVDACRRHHRIRANLKIKLSSLALLSNLGL